MQRRRKAAAIMMLAAMFVGSEVGRASAQQAPPDLRMLMDLDLFEPRNNSAGAAASGAAPSDDSMLNQIQTLDQMGALGHHQPAAQGGDAQAPRATNGGAPAPASGAEDVAPPMTPQQMPSSAPSADVEGPLP
jgi:hypothetical protein